MEYEIVIRMKVQRVSPGKRNLEVRDEKELLARDIRNNQFLVPPKFSRNIESIKIIEVKKDGS